MSLNFGSIYRGSGSDGRLFVHGEPINTGTKALTRYSKKIELIGELPEEVSILEAKPSTSLKLVGRNRELATISGKLNSQGFQLCGVFGERGIGKTAILNHIMDYQAQKFGSLSFIKCSPSGALHELGVIGDVIHKATAQLVSKMSIEEVESLILAQLAKDRQNAQHISLFKEILPDEIFRQAIEVPIIRSEKLSLLTGFATSMMRLLSCSKSMLIVIDECHLIDPESERVFGSLAQENANLKILLATREKSQCGLVKHPNLISLAHILTLGPIAKTYFGELFRSIELGPENDWDSVVEVSGGNPFYAIQIAFAKKEGVSSTDQPLDDIVKERLGLLTRPQLMMLRLISCYSRPASTEFLENAASRIGLRDSPTDHLEALVRLRLARRSNSEPLALEVAHGLVSKSVLEISPEGAISSIFETLARSASAKEDSGDRIALEVHELALLWENAQASGRAAILHSRAADIAADKGYFRSAAKFYENAVRQLKSNKAIAARVNSWNVETAECLWAIGDVKGADTSIKRYRRNERFEIKNKRSKDTLARASAIEAETSYFTGNFADLLMAQWRLGKYNLSEGSNELARVRGYASLAYTVGIFRLLPLAHYFANKATKIGLGINNGRSVAHGLAAKGLLFFVFGEWEKGEVAFSEAFSHLSSAVDEQHLFEVIHTLLGLGAHQQGKAQVAKFHFSQLKESAVRRGHKLHEGWVEYSLASLFLSQGKPEQALNHINLADPLIAGKGDLQSQHICAGLHARIHWDLNQRDLALQWAKTAHEFSVKLPPRNFSSIEAYAAPPLIFALARKENHQSPNELDQIIKPLANYAMIFPTARSRFHLIKALVLGATNKSKSKQHIARSQGLREKFRIGSDDNLQAQIKTSLGELN
ncbi:MAG: AAA family ATPase [Parasphingorhabdus sp.]